MCTDTAIQSRKLLKIMIPKYYAFNIENSISNSIKAKVELVYGKKVQERLMQTKEFMRLPLWGDFDGVVLMFSKEGNHQNAHRSVYINSGVLYSCLHHPNYILW